MQVSVGSLGLRKPECGQPAVESAQQRPACRIYAFLHVRNNSERYIVTDQKIQCMVSIHRVCFRVGIGLIVPAAWSWQLPAPS